MIHTVENAAQRGGMRCAMNLRNVRNARNLKNVKLKLGNEYWKIMEC